MTVNRKADDRNEDVSDLPPDLRPELTAEELFEIERRFDPETSFRPTGTVLAFFITAVLVGM